MKLLQIIRWSYFLLIKLRAWYKVVTYLCSENTLLVLTWFCKAPKQEGDSADALNLHGTTTFNTEFGSFSGMYFGAPFFSLFFLCFLRTFFIFGKQSWWTLQTNAIWQILGSTFSILENKINKMVAVEGTLEI